MQSMKVWVTRAEKRAAASPSGPRAARRRPWRERRTEARVFEWKPGMRPLTVPRQIPSPHPMRTPATTRKRCRHKG
jgi:hypothetical protein